MSEFDYLRDPEAIYRASFAAIDQAADWTGVAAAMVPVYRRLVHACGMVDILSDLRHGNDVAPAARAALVAGAPVIADCEMVAHGIIRRFLPAGNPVLCFLNHEGVAARAQQMGTTRSAAAIAQAGEKLEGAVVAIGNAPTALFALLEMMAAQGVRPAAILGFPVGFIGAAESKQALTAHHQGVGYVTLLGQRGGSALAAAAVNALAVESMR
ncbi:MAG TPA: precorrin-8X methylmutase [Alphaproteobacteria bacterium]|nr:precorrin-8X methylmutase [Alphaproteobacteria bacterium]